MGGRSERGANAAVANTDPANGKAVNPNLPAWRANPETRDEPLARLDGVTATKLLEGKSVGSPEALVAALQPLADMPYEIAHVIVLDKNGKPVQPAQSWEGGVNEVRLNWAAVGRELVQGAQNGGDTAYLVHHHPGNGDVGKEDVGATREFGKLAETAGLKMGGHLVLRPNGEWSAISADGDVAVELIEAARVGGDHATTVADQHARHARFAIVQPSVLIGVEIHASFNGGAVADGCAINPNDQTDDGREK